MVMRKVETRRAVRVKRKMESNLTNYFLHFLADENLHGTNMNHKDGWDPSEER